MTELDTIFIYNNELLSECKDQIQYYTAIKTKLSSSISLYERTIIIFNTLQILLPITITLFESLKGYITTLSQLELNIIPISLSSSLSLLISFSKYFQFETTLATMNNIDSRYTFIIARIRHRQRCILKIKSDNKIDIDKTLVEFDKDTLDTYIEQTLNDTDSKIKNVVIKEINATQILNRQYKNRTINNFNDIIQEEEPKIKKKSLFHYLFSFCCKKNNNIISVRRIDNATTPNLSPVIDDNN